MSKNLKIVLSAITGIITLIFLIDSLILLFKGERFTIFYLCIFIVAGLNGYFVYVLLTDKSEPCIKKFFVLLFGFFFSFYIFMSRFFYLLLSFIKLLEYRFLIVVYLLGFGGICIFYLLFLINMAKKIKAKSEKTNGNILWRNQRTMKSLAIAAIFLSGLYLLLKIAQFLNSLFRIEFNWVVLFELKIIYIYLYDLLFAIPVIVLNIFCAVSVFLNRPRKKFPVQIVWLAIAAALNIDSLLNILNAFSLNFQTIDLIFMSLLQVALLFFVGALSAIFVIGIKNFLRQLEQSELKETVY